MWELNDIEVPGVSHVALDVAQDKHLIFFSSAWLCQQRSQYDADIRRPWSFNWNKQVGKVIVPE